MTPAAAAAQRMFEVDTWLGVQGVFSLVVVLLGIMSGIQGFAYLFHMEKLDFYESQPMSRRERFRQIYINGILLYVVPMITMCMLAVLIAACSKAMSVPILLDTLYEILRNILTYYASFNIAILAVMLSGNGIISGIVTVILMLAQSVVSGMIFIYQSSFYATYYAYDKNPGISLSPMINWVQGLLLQDEITGSTLKPLTASMLRDIIKVSCSLELTNLAVGTAALLAAWLLYRRRKAEYAGQSVLHAPVRFVLKAFVAICSALMAGMMIIWIINVGRPDSTEHVFAILAILFVCVVSCGVTECIYQQNIRRFFGAGLQTILICLASVAIYVFFALDISGYDRYVPSEDQIESAALYKLGNDYFYPGRFLFSERTDMETHIFENMALTDTEAIVEAAGIGMETKRENAEQISRAESVEKNWECIILYRLKNGREVARRIAIPYTVDPALMDRLVGTKQYREAVFPVYDDERIRNLTMEEQKQSADTVDDLNDNAFIDDNTVQVMEAFPNTNQSEGFMPDLGYTNGIRSNSMNISLYSAFSDAYRKDLEKYTYTLSSSEVPIGMVTFENNYYPYFSESFPVYQSYTQTIQFLKENGLYLDDFRKEELPSVTVTKYNDNDYKEKTFSKSEEIRTILEHAIPNRLQGDWLDPERMWDMEIMINTAGKYSGHYESLQFIQDEVPAFVLEAFEQ